MRLAGRQVRWLIGAGVCVVLMLVSAMLVDALIAQFHPVFEWEPLRGNEALSGRSRVALADTTGVITVTCVFPSESPAALPVGRLLRRFAQASGETGGAVLSVNYVDPRMDAGVTAQCVAQGAEGAGVLFRQAARRVFVPEAAFLGAAGGYDPVEAENAVAAALLRLSRADGLEIGWLVGHGEPSFESTQQQSGFSGFRRALESEGCRLRNLTLDVSSALDSGIPAEVGALMVVSPKYPITSVERAVLMDWLDKGGRLFCILPTTGDAGLGPLLEEWGIRVGAALQTPLRLTLYGDGLSDQLNTEHAVTRDLAGRATLFFTAPRSLFLNAPRGTVVTPLVWMPVVSGAGLGAQPSEPVCVMAAAERGGGGVDLALRSGRLVVVADAAFAANQFVLNHATANRDLAVQVVRWLTGLSGSGARSDVAEVLRLGLDRRSWRVVAGTLVCVVPMLVCAALWLLTRRWS